MGSQSEFGMYSPAWFQKPQGQFRVGVRAKEKPGRQYWVKPFCVGGWEVLDQRVVPGHLM